MAGPCADWNPECSISLLSGSAVRLPLFGDGGGGADLTDLLIRAVALFAVQPDANAHFTSLPIRMLALSNNTAGSPLFGEAVPTSEALRAHAEDARRASVAVDLETGDRHDVLLCFTLTAVGLEESTCGVQRCREGVTRQSLLRRNREGYCFTYPVAFMILDSPQRPLLVEFPPFSGISVNMMPFIIGEKNSLPLNLRGYWPLIQACGVDIQDPSEVGKVGYLTVDEQEIEEDQTTHRRGGLHTDSPGVHIPGLQPSAPAPCLRRSPSEDRWDAWHRGDLAERPAHPSRGYARERRERREREREQPPRDFHPRGAGACEVKYHPWGIGMVQGNSRRGGIYMASTVGESAQIYNAVVEDPSLIGHLGSCEHLRDFLGPPTVLGAGELCWFTDRTPHESLPLPAGTRRQFFRLVTSQVGVWYADHSTPNPQGVVPDAWVTRVLRGSKFDRNVGWEGGPQQA